MLKFSKFATLSAQLPIFDCWANRVRLLAAILALSVITVAGSGPPDDPRTNGGVAIERLIEQLSSDPQRLAGEEKEAWLKRLYMKNLEVSDRILTHPAATPKHTSEAIGRKLGALSGLARRDPTRFKTHWMDFANRVIRENPGSPLSREAARNLLDDKLSDSPADPTIELEIERFVRTYPESDGLILHLYVRFTQLLYDHDKARALAVLDRVITSLPSDIAGQLRQHRNQLTMVGTKLAMSFRKLDGKRLKLEHLRGKVVFVYSWATWCGPCIEKFPMLKDLHTRYHSAGFEIVAVSQNEKMSEVVEFFKTHKYPWINVLHSKEYEDKYGRMGTPGSLLVDREGTVVGRSIFKREEIESALRRLLEEGDQSEDR